MAASTALVTGATGGIGLLIARQFAERGWAVLVGARDAARGTEAAAQVGGRPVVLNVTDAGMIAAAAGAVPELDVLVNNAGISLDTGTVVTETGVEVFRHTYETNVFGVVAVTNAFLPALRRSAHPRIVNLSSGTGSLTWSTAPNPQFDYRAAGTGSGAAYRSSKAALNALTAFYAQALADDGVKVNALAPGLRATNLNPQAAARGGDPAEAAAGAVRLALLPDDGPSGQLFSWDGTVVPW
jgi:NAD(P)-dependent dehydrogenase (short-subunit alcohol dehydrogenase family)